MDIQKLCEKVLESTEAQGIPILYVYMIINCVLEVIDSGECFYTSD